MSERITWSLNVQVAGGPKTALSRTIDVDAYDKISIEIPGATAEESSGSREVEVQPAAETSLLRFLSITADRYSELTVTPGDPRTGPVIQLDGPLLLFSQGAFGLLGEEAPRSLTFSNGLDTPVKIDILVGRNVTAGGS